MKRKTIVSIILFAMVAGWMILIFSMSAQPADLSTRTSGNTIRMIYNVIYPGFKDMESAEQGSIIEASQHFIRKAAHFSIYTVLGILLSLAMSRHTDKFFIISFTVGVLYSISDEIHQRFVPGRSGQISDVILDSAGVALGCTIIFILYKIIRKKRAN